MATICIAGDSVSIMFGMGAFSGISTSFKNAVDSADNLSGAIKQLKTKIDLATVGTDVSASQTTAETAEKREVENHGALSNAYQKLEEFINDVGKVDIKVSDKIKERKDDFYSRYYYLKPECEKSNKEKYNDWKKEKYDEFVEWCEGVKNFFIGVVEAIKEHWLEIIAAIVIIAVGAILTVLTGGAALTLAAFATAFLQGLAVAATIGIATALVQSGVTYISCRMAGYSHSQAMLFTGKAFGDGFSSGFLSGACTYTGNALGGFLQFKGITKVPKILNVTEKIGKIGSGVNTAVGYIGKYGSIIFPDSNLIASIKEYSNSYAYKLIDKGFDVMSITSGAASKTYTYKVETVKQYSVSTEKGSVFYGTSNGEILPVKCDTVEVLIPYDLGDAIKDKLKSCIWGSYNESDSSIKKVTTTVKNIKKYVQPFKEAFLPGEKQYDLVSKSLEYSW